MGASVSLNDIDIAHRVPLGDSTREGPKSIVCKFARRLARMIGSNIIWRCAGQQGQRDGYRFRRKHKLCKRKGGWSSNSQDAKTLCGCSVAINNECHFAFCWMKSGSILLRLLADSSPYRVRNVSPVFLIVSAIYVLMIVCQVIFAMSSLTQAMQNKNLLRELPYSGHNIILCAMGNSTTSSRLIISQLKSIWNVSLAFMTFFLTLTLNWHLSFPFEHTEIY